MGRAILPIVPAMSHLIVTPYSALETTVLRRRPSHVLTLMDEPVETPPTIEPKRHLRILVHDVTEPVEGAVAPARDHIIDILAFARGWDQSRPFLVHCWAGISRSTAAAFIVLCDIHGPGHEDAIARGLRVRAPHAQPNRLMIRHADALLGSAGRMIQAIEALGEARVAAEGAVTELPLRLDAL
jgi:predicted protein tyrosine phosphatase